MELKKWAIVIFSKSKTRCESEATERTSKTRCESEATERQGRSSAAIKNCSLRVRRHGAVPGSSALLGLVEAAGAKGLTCLPSAFFNSLSYNLSCGGEKR